MTALCGGGPSGAKPTSPAAAYLVGNTLENIIEAAFGLSEAWAALLIFVAAQSIQTSSFCTTDPPTLVWPTADDILYITTHPWDLGATAYQHLYSVVQNGLWWTFCQCTSTTTPAPPTPPNYPTTALQVNPPGFGNQSAAPCYTTTNSITYIPVGGDQNILPTTTRSLIGITNGPVTVQYSGSYNLVSGTDNGGYNLQLIYDTATTSNNLASTLNIFGTGLPGGGPGIVHTLTTTLPSTATAWRVRTESSNGSGETITLIALANAFCGGQTPTTTVSECCPPDPTIWAQLQQIQQFLSLIYQGLPAPIHSYASGTAHSGLHDNGTITLSGSAIAIRVDITTDPSALGVSTGNPLFLFERGYIVPVVNSAPIRTEVRLVYNPQMYILPSLTQQIGYSLHPGVVATITELTAGP